MNYQELAIEFQALPNDVERWGWIIAHRDMLHVACDNDWTGAYFDGDDNEDPYCLTFDGYVGCNRGVLNLLKAIGINASSV